MPIATILAILAGIEQLLPAAQGVAALVEKALSGQQINDTDLAQLKATADAVDAQVQAAIAAQGAPPVA